MEEKDHIKELFQNQLSGLETPVRPEIWSAVSSSIGATTATTTTAGLSLLAKWTIGALTAASITGVTWFALRENPAKPQKIDHQKDTIVQQKSQPKQEVSDKKNSVEPMKMIFTPPIVKEAEPAEITAELNSNSNVESSYSLPMSYADLKQVQASENTVSFSDSKSNTSSLSKNTQKEVVDEVKETKMPEKSNLNLELPNVFTPNGDGNNDYLQLQASEINEFSLVVLDASGKTVFKTQDPDFKWDGKGFSDELLPVGNYVYFVTGKDDKGKQVSKYSTLTIKY